MISKVVVCRAAGIQGWVVECQYKDGRKLLDLDIQAKELPDCIELAEKEYPKTEVTIEADSFWTKGHNTYLLNKYGKTNF